MYIIHQIEALKNPRCDLNNKKLEFVYMGAVVGIELRAQNLKKWQQISPF